MLGFQDTTRAIDERNDARINIRTKPRIKAAIQQAAAFSGIDDSVFTMNAAYHAALETNAAHERTMLQPVDHDAFFSGTRYSESTDRRLALSLPSAWRDGRFAVDGCLASGLLLNIFPALKDGDIPSRKIEPTINRQRRPPPWPPRSYTG